MSILCTSPLAKGLFRRVILESSIVASGEPPHSFRSMEEALSSGEEVLARYRAENVSDLRKLPPESIAGSMDTAHHITVLGYVLTETPSKSYQKDLHNERAILHGFNLHDSVAFLVFSKTTKGTMDSQVREYYGAHADDLLKLYPSADDKQAVEDWGGDLRCSLLRLPVLHTE